MHIDSDPPLSNVEKTHKTLIIVLKVYQIPKFPDNIIAGFHTINRSLTCFIMPKELPFFAPIFRRILSESFPSPLYNYL